MGSLARRKGKVAEREAARLVRECWGLPARRGRQYAGHPDAPDVVSVAGLHVEVKARERGCPGTWLDLAQQQAGDALAVVLHRRRRKPWLLTVQADRLRELLALLGAEGTTRGGGDAA